MTTLQKNEALSTLRRSTMSNHLHKLFALLFLTFCARSSFAQSDELLQALRVQTLDAFTKSEQEWQACFFVNDAGTQNKCDRFAELSLLLAVQKLSANDPSAALQQLDLAAAPAGLESFWHFYRAESLFWSNAKYKSLAEFRAAKASAPDWLERRIDVRLAETLLELSDFNEALKAFEPLNRNTPSPEVRYGLALVNDALGNEEAAANIFHLILVETPTDVSVPWIEQWFSKHQRPIQFTEEERLSRIAKFASDSNWVETIREVTTVRVAHPALSHDNQAMTAFFAAQAYAALKRYDLFKEEIAIAETGATAVAVEALMLEARHYMRYQDGATAVQILNSLTKKFPQSPLAAEAAYLAAWMPFERGEYLAASTGLGKFASTYPNVRRTDEALWFRAYSLFKLGQFSECEKALSSLIDRFPNSSLVPQSIYWRWRSVVQRTKEKELSKASIDQLQKLFSQWPNTLYGQMARTRLIAARVQVPESLPAVPDEPGNKNPPTLLKQADLLLRAGLFKDAQDELTYTFNRIQNGVDALAVAQWLKEREEPGLSYGITARWLWAQAMTGHDPLVLPLLYPRAFCPTVRRWSEKHKVDSSYMWALMRRESLFKPDVRSSADARGLLQLILPTAQALALQNKQPMPDGDALFAPDLNISLSTCYVKSLFERFKHPALVAAAYNAGPGAVVRWMKARGQLPLDEFVEEIPFKETRGYVKQVVADYYVYQTLYREPGNAVPVLSMQIETPSETGVDF